MLVPRVELRVLTGLSAGVTPWAAEAACGTAGAAGGGVGVGLGVAEGEPRLCLPDTGEEVADPGKPLPRRPRAGDAVPGVGLRAWVAPEAPGTGEWRPR